MRIALSVERGSSLTTALPLLPEPPTTPKVADEFIREGKLALCVARTNYVFMPHAMNTIIFAMNVSAASLSIRSSSHLDAASSVRRFSATAW